MKARDPYNLLNLWKRRHRVTSIVLMSLFALVLMGSFWLNILNFTTAIITSIIGALSLFWLNKRSLPEIDDSVQLAHDQNVNLEYSSQLLSPNIDESELTTLALLQKERVQKMFSSFSYELPLNKRLILLSLILLTAIYASGWSIQSLMDQDELVDINKGTISDDSKDTAQLIGADSSFISGLSVIVQPPAYTSLARRQIAGPSLEVPEGSKVKWNIKVNRDVNQLFMIFSEGDTIDINNKSYSRGFVQSDYYQYGFYDEAKDYFSDYHSIRVIPDEKAQVAILGIEEYVRLDYQEDYKISFDILIEDDYGISDAYISATVAKGSGESVKFREKKFELKNLKLGSAIYKGSFAFSTAEFKMEPGDELFFYVNAKDNYPYSDRWSKSVTHFVAINDTTTYEYAEDAGMQVDFMPDFFRSQRQIIIDTKQLMSERPSMHQDTFRQRSNALGFDQKLLRLKYGQFLGEEDESGIDINNELDIEEEHDHEDHNHEEGGASEALEGARDLLNQFMHDHDHEEEAGELLSTKGTQKREDASRPTWVEELSHNHDDSEVSTFHNVSVKSKLRAALSVMWDAELHLRLYDPETSLPYQYESLELLQEVKNHARIYVHRIGFDPPVIKEQDVRLQGDQDKVVRPITTANNKAYDPYVVIKNTIELLGLPDSKDRMGQLRSTTSSIAKIAITRPEILPALNEIQSLLSTNEIVSAAEYSEIRKLLIDLLPIDPLPVSDRYNNTLEYTKDVTRKIGL